MKKLLASTAIVAMSALPIAAQTSDNSTMGTGDFTYTPQQGEMPVSAARLIGKRVYTSEKEVDASSMMNEVGDGWDDIGEVSDLLLDSNDEVEAILVDVGGFLGIGEKTVAVKMDALKMVPDGDDKGDYFLVFAADREQLENAPVYEDPMAEMKQKASNAADEAGDSMNQAATKAGDMANDASQDVKAAASGAAASVSSAADKAGQKVDNAADHAKAEMSDNETPVDLANVKAEQLQDAPVYDANDEKVGSIEKIVLNDDGSIGKTVIDIGGFLGIGAKPVAFDFNELKITADADDKDDLRVHVAQSEEQMKQMPEYKDAG